MTLLPKLSGLRLEDTLIEDDTVSLTLASTSLSVPCPICDQKTMRLHSHYGRTVADLPWSGRRVKLFLRVRKFRCPQKGCPRRVFTERLPSVVKSYARKTVRLHEILELVGFALGGEAGARLIRRLLGKNVTSAAYKGAEYPVFPNSDAAIRYVLARNVPIPTDIAEASRMIDTLLPDPHRGLRDWCNGHPPQIVRMRRRVQAMLRERYGYPADGWHRRLNVAIREKLERQEWGRRRQLELDAPLFRDVIVDPLMKRKRGEES